MRPHGVDYIITDPYSLLDFFGGAPTGDFNEDFIAAQGQGVSFSLETHQNAMQLLEQP